MQRRDEREPPLGSHHLLRKHGRDGVGDGVMHVQQIQTVGFGHIHHARRQRQAIGRVLEQRIVGHLHFVVVNARNAGVQANGIRIGYEVDLMPAIGELQA